MGRGARCRREVLETLRESYDNFVLKRYNGCFIEALEDFNKLAESSLRSVLTHYYSNQRSRDQAWRSCKGALYEYAVFRGIQSVIESKRELREKLAVMMGDEVMVSYRDQIVIRNWCDILPDVDMVIVEKESNSVKAIISCKTSLRERLTETAFWKRE